MCIGGDGKLCKMILMVKHLNLNFLHVSKLTRTYLTCVFVARRLYSLLTCDRNFFSRLTRFFYGGRRKYTFCPSTHDGRFMAIILSRLPRESITNFSRLPALTTFIRGGPPFDPLVIGDPQRRLCSYFCWARIIITTANHHDDIEPTHLPQESSPNR